jgi:hypothetical protein
MLILAYTTLDLNDASLLYQSDLLISFLFHQQHQKEKSDISNGYGLGEANS